MPGSGDGKPGNAKNENREQDRQNEVKVIFMIYRHLIHRSLKNIIVLQLMAYDEKHYIIPKCRVNVFLKK